MAENFLIGQLAERTGRSVHTIRWYEAQGLIPGVARDSGRRRVYGELHISWLDLMDRLRRTGMSIAEMREYTELVKQGSGTLARRQALLAAHREQVKGMISEWQQALTLLNTKIDFYDEWVASGKRPAVKAVKKIERAGGASRPRSKEKPRLPAKA
jgi:DNA-binding transcriptional MerR regulator